MKKIVTAVFLTLINLIFGQNGPTPDPNTCVTNQNLYTKTTNPDDPTPYTFSSNSFNYNLNPNGLNGPTNFDWVNTVSINCYTNIGMSANSAFVIRSPFYCNGMSSYLGGCLDPNTAVFNNINQDPLNQFNNDAAAKLKAMDILPEDGWELLKYGFGRPVDPNIPNDQGVAEYNPWFWLYNRFTGKLKLFVAITNVNISTAIAPNAAIIKIETDPPGKYDLFANAKPFTHIYSDFDHVTNINSVTNNGYLSLNPINNGLQYYWAYAEFVASYDPCVCRQMNNNLTRLKWELITVQTSNLQGTMRSVSPSNIYSGSGLVPDNTSNSSFKISDNAGSSVGSQLVAGSQEVIKGYKDWKEFAEKFKDYYNTTTANGTSSPTADELKTLIDQIAIFYNQQNASNLDKTKLSFDLINGVNVFGYNPQPNSPATSEDVVKFLAGLKVFAQAGVTTVAPSAAPYVGAFFSFVNFLATGGSKKSGSSGAAKLSPPTINALDATIQGTITTNQFLNTGSIWLPGEYVNKDMSVPGQKNEDQNFPIYNNALGIFNIISVPDFEYKLIPISNNAVDVNDPDVTGAPGNFFDSFDGFSGINGINVRDYKMTGAIKYALNPGAKLNILSIDAAYVLEYNGDDPLVLKSNAYYLYTPSPKTEYTTTIDFKQVLYYPNMQSKTFRFNTVTDPKVEGDNIQTVLDGLQAKGFEVDYRSSTYTTSLGTNTNTARIRIRTPYLPIQYLPSYDFVLVGSATNTPKMYLKLVCRFSKIDFPDDEPVTMVFTYDISKKLKDAQQNGQDGYGSVNYYYALHQRNNCINCDPNQSEDNYARFKNLSVVGAYFNAHYGGPGGTWNDVGNGACSTDAINIPSNVDINSNWAANTTKVVSTMEDINVGSGTSLGGPSNASTALYLKARKNINIGDFCQINPTCHLYAGKNIVMGNGASIGNSASAQAKPRLFANNKIIINSTSPSSLSDCELYAANEIEFGGELNISGEVDIYSKSNLIPIEAILHNSIYELPTNSSEATTGDINNACSNLSLRVMRSPEKPQSVDTIFKVNPEEMNDATDFDRTIEIYPNPNQGLVFISSASVLGALRYSVEDICGKTIVNEEINIPDKIYMIDLNQLVNGVYILRLESDGFQKRPTKLIVQK